MYRELPAFRFHIPTIFLLDYAKALVQNSPMVARAPLLMRDRHAINLK
jgi:hypothetical protein